jgi:ribulose-5-phosphate 4-epimerase/fuculose-1-phosphate aldolase
MTSTYSEIKTRNQIARVGADLFNRRYAIGTAGNISALLKDGWLITPTDACLGHLEPDAIAKVDLHGSWISGAKPSKTLALHRGIYESNPSIGGIVHTHATHLVALSLQGVWSEQSILPPLTPYQVMKVGKIPLLEYRRPGHPDVAKQVRSLAASVKGVLLSRLGPVVWGRDVEEAASILEELEETARLWLSSDPKPSPLSNDEITDLCTSFGAYW